MASVDTEIETSIATSRNVEDSSENAHSLPSAQSSKLVTQGYG